MSQKSRKRTHEEVEVDENESVAPKRQMKLRSRKRPALSAIDVNSQELSGPSEQPKRRRDSVFKIPDTPDNEDAPTASTSQSAASIESPGPPQRSVTPEPQSELADIRTALKDVKLCIDFKDLRKNATISRSFKSIKLVNLYEKFERRCKHFEENFVPWIGHSVKEIELEKCKLTSNQLIRILRHLPNVEALVLREVNIDDTMPVDEFRMPKLRRVECDIVNMIKIQDFLVDCHNLVEIIVKGSYREMPNFVINPTIDVFNVLRPLILRQENLRTLEIADSAFFGSEAVQHPPFQLQKLHLSMANVSKVELPNLYGFLRSQHEIGVMNFDITLQSKKRRRGFKRSLDYVLNMPTLTDLSLVIFSRIGMRQVFKSDNVNNSVRTLAVNLTECNFPMCLKRVVRRFPMVESLWLTNSELASIPNFLSVKFLEPLRQLRNLHTLKLDRFTCSQVKRVRCPQLTSFKFEPIDNNVMHACLFFIAHRQLRDVALTLTTSLKDEIEQLHHLVEFVLRFHPTILQLRLCTPIGVLDEERIQAAVDRYKSAEFKIITCQKTFQKN